MKRFLSLIGIVVLVYLIVQFFLPLFSDGHEVQYIINDEITIDESFYAKAYTGDYLNRKTYFFKFKIGDYDFSFKIFDDYARRKRIIKRVEYKESDSSICIMPFDLKGNPMFTYLLCKNKEDGILFNYVSQSDMVMNDFIETLSIDGYIYPEVVIPQKRDTLGDNDLYDTLIENHRLVIWKYDGIYIIDSDSMEEVDVFSRSHYDNPLGKIVGSYYVMPNYDLKYDFSGIRMVQLETLAEEDFDIGMEISHDAYIQGVEGNNLYIYDLENESQFVVDIKDKSAEEVNEFDNFYNQFEFEAVDSKLFLDKLKFNNYFDKTELMESYDRVERYGGGIDGYYYLYNNLGTITAVYRIDVLDPNNIKLIFTGENINEVCYLDEYVYYIDGEKLYYFSDNTGRVKLVNNFEFNFNYENIFEVSKK